MFVQSHIQRTRTHQLAAACATSPINHHHHQQHLRATRQEVPERKSRSSARATGELRLGVESGSEERSCSPLARASRGLSAGRPERADKWTQVERAEPATIDEAAARDEPERGGALARLAEFWTDVCLWPEVQPDLEGPQGGHTEQADLKRGPGAGERCRALALFWLNFVAFQLETLRQIYQQLLMHKCQFSSEPDGAAPVELAEPRPTGSGGHASGAPIALVGPLASRRLITAGHVLPHHHHHHHHNHQHHHAVNWHALQSHGHWQSMCQASYEPPPSPEVDQQQQRHQQWTGHSMAPLVQVSAARHTLDGVPVPPRPVARNLWHAATADNARLAAAAAARPPWQLADSSHVPRCHWQPQPKPGHPLAASSSANTGEPEAAAAAAGDSKQASCEEGRRSTESASSGASNADHQPAPAAPTKKKLNPLARVSLAGARRRLGFKRQGGGLNSLSVHRSEEILPAECAQRRRLFAEAAELSETSEASRATSSSSANGSLCAELELTAGAGPWLTNASASLAASPSPGASGSGGGGVWRHSADPQGSFVEGLGAGQVAGRQALVSPYLGDIQLGLSDRRGMLEVEVIRVRQLAVRAGAKRLPSPYVKVYLMRDKKCLAKFKTRQAHETLDPLYQQLFLFRDDYAHCLLQVIVWADYGRRDRKVLMGAAQINMDQLDVSSALVIGWYKLLNAPSMASQTAAAATVAALALAGSSRALRQTMSSTQMASSSTRRAAPAPAAPADQFNE